MILESYFIFKFNSRLDIVEERIVKLEGKFVEVETHSPSKLVFASSIYIRHVDAFTLLLYFHKISFHLD